MTNQYKTGIPAKVQTMVDGITTALGNSSALDFSKSIGFKIVLELSPDGNTITMRAWTTDQGQNLRPAFHIDTAQMP